MSGGMKLLDRIEIDLGNDDDRLTVYIDAWDHSLGRKWLSAIKQPIRRQLSSRKELLFLWIR